MSALLTTEDLGKRYLLRPERSLLLGLTSRGRPRSFWALRDLNVHLNTGEVLAVIGRNGAGKSTLLKLAAGVTAPSSGTLMRTRRIAPLIEVGAGFHPDLSGRENVEVNARLLGLGKSQLRERFDAILAFSELERVIDRPVKEYSSGMFMRLGFSVAVHTDPEMLVVDEVLAVGDMPFQVRCLKRIRAMREDGVGVLFVSHNMSAVLELADRAVLLDRGEHVVTGATREVVGAYHARLQADVERFEDRGIASSDALDVTVDVRSESGEDAPLLWESNQRARVLINVHARREAGPAVVGFRVRKEGTGLVSAWHQTADEIALPALAQGEHAQVTLELDLNVVAGSYTLELALGSPDMRVSYADVHDVATFAVAGSRRASGVADLRPVVIPAEGA